MQPLWFSAAAIISAVTFYVHTFVGGPRVAGPLLADDQLPKASKWLSYFCWHIATVLLATMTLSFIAVAIQWVSNDIAWLLGGLSIILSALSAGVALKGGINPFRFPSTSLFFLSAAAVLGGALS